MKDVIISPSILSADFKNLHEELNKISQSGAKWIHFDVMDGHFVDNISFGIPVLESISKAHGLINDVHLMISDPLHYALRFLDAGADYLTFHLEALKSKDDIFRLIDLIHSQHKKVGISIKPGTDVLILKPYLHMIDLVLIMSVEPGFGGQQFMDNALGKITFLKDYKQTNHLDYLIEVDGGINEKTGPLCTFFGADVLVSGSYIFKADDYKKQIDKLKS